MGFCPILSEGASRVKPETICPLSSSSGLFWLPRPPWLLLEVQDHGLILYDPQGVLANKLDAVRQRMRELGTKKVMMDDGSWYWDIKPDWKPGEVFEL